MNASSLQHTMWTTMCKDSARSVDKHWLSTTPKTTQLQDVMNGLGVCGVVNLVAIGKHTVYPQSTGLITVISSSYKHPHLTIKA
jgi:hypothetical protein